MPDFSTYIDIDPSEYFDSCSDREKKELIEHLCDEGFIVQNQLEPKNKSVLDLEWDAVCEKVRTNRLRLSNVEEETIRNVASRL